MNNKPLSYPSLKCVFQYMEANQRFHLSHHAPFIRSAEKAAPLYIHNLLLSPTELKINNFKYQLGIIRKFTHGEPPTWIQTSNEFGGVKHDLEEFGAEDKSCDMVMTPGDLLIKNSYLAHEERNEEGMMFDEQVLERLRRKPKDKTTDCLIKYYEEKLFAWQHRRLNIRPQYDSYIQFTVTESRAEKVIERMEYNKKMYQAMKYLSDKFFGKRKITMNVGTLSIVLTNECVLRLPENMKMRIQGLEIMDNVAELMNSLDHIVDRRSFPLKTIKMNHGVKFVQYQNYEHPIIRTAKKLYIPGGGHRVSDAWFDIFLKLPNTKITVEYGDFSQDKYIYLIDNLLEEKREIGTSYMFNIWEQETITELFKLLKRHEKATLAFYDDPRCITFPYGFVFPINDFLKLDVFCTENPKYIDDERYRTPKLTLWMNFHAREPKMLVSQVKQKTYVSETNETMDNNNKFMMVTGSIVAVILGFLLFNLIF